MVSTRGRESVREGSLICTLGFRPAAHLPNSIINVTVDIVIRVTVQCLRCIVPGTYEG